MFLESLIILTICWKRLISMGKDVEKRSKPPVVITAANSNIYIPKQPRT